MSEHETTEANGGTFFYENNLKMSWKVYFFVKYARIKYLILTKLGINTKSVYTVKGKK